MTQGDKVKITIFPHDTIYTVTGVREMNWNTYYFLDNSSIPFLESELEVIS